MDLIVDDRHRGTCEITWLESGRLSSLPALHITPARRLVVVAPHPDDEVFGVGGLMQCMHQLGAEIVVVLSPTERRLTPGHNRGASTWVRHE